MMSVGCRVVSGHGVPCYVGMMPEGNIALRFLERCYGGFTEWEMPVATGPRQAGYPCRLFFPFFSGLRRLYQSSIVRCYAVRSVRGGTPSVVPVSCIWMPGGDKIPRSAMGLSSNFRGKIGRNSEAMMEGPFRFHFLRS